MNIRNSITSIFLACALSVSAQNYDTVTGTIDQIIYDRLPDGSDIALMVYDLTADTTIYAYRERVMCRPASVQKVVTSITALSSLGTDYTFDTRLCSLGSISQDSVLNGDLYLIGGLDPSLMEQDLKDMVAGLKKAGIKRVRGKVYADVSAMDSIFWGSGWCWDDAPSSFQPYISPLMVHEGYVGVQVKPAAKGQAPEVVLFPSNSYVTVENTALTGVPSKGPLKITRDWTNNSNTIRISGNCTKRQATDLSVVGTDKFAFALFREYMEQAGIRCDGYGWAECPAMANTLVTVSHGIQGIMKEALKESNNLYAECMFLQTGRINCPKGVSFTESAKFTENFVARKFGFRSSQFNVVDGCGLSMYDMFSPSFMVDMLSMIYKDRKLYDILYRSLPVSGVDGTLKTRMNSKNSITKVHAKTGSVTGACTLAGYLKTANGHDVAFCIMNEGVLKMAASRNLQDAICEALCEFGM